MHSLQSVNGCERAKEEAQCCAVSSSQQCGLVFVGMFNMEF